MKTSQNQKLVLNELEKKIIHFLNNHPIDCISYITPQNQLSDINEPYEEVLVALRNLENYRAISLNSRKKFLFFNDPVYELHRERISELYEQTKSN